MIKYVRLAAPALGGEKSARDVLLSLNLDFYVSFFSSRSEKLF